MAKTPRNFAGEWSVEAKSDFKPSTFGSYMVELTQEEDKIVGKGWFPKQALFDMDYECQISGNIDDNQAKLEMQWNNEGGISQVIIYLSEDETGFEGRYMNTTDEGIYRGIRYREH